MSAIFGTFSRQGKGASKQVLEAMKEATDYWMPDATETWVRGPVGMGQHLLWNTPESRLDSLPRVSKDNRELLAIVADVRLDNRAELAGLLVDQSGIAGKNLSSITDTELLLAAYREWGLDSPRRLLGDFSYVIWDEGKHSLFCVRDHVGVKPLYYCLAPKCFVFANDMRAFRANDDVSGNLDEKAFAYYLLDGELFHSERTFLKDVKKLPSGNAMLVTVDEVRQIVYWRPEDAPKTRCDNLDEYAARLRELLTEAVSARLRTAYPVATHLSGGLDSSMLAVLAGRECRRTGQDYATYNWAHSPGPSDNSDEAEWALGIAVAEQEGLRYRFLEMDEEFVAQELFGKDLICLETTDVLYDRFMRDKAQEHEARVILSGWGGDELITNQGRSSLSDDFWCGRPIRALKTLLHEARLGKRPVGKAARLLVDSVLLPVMPGFVARRFSSSVAPERSFMDFVSPEFRMLAAEQEALLRKKNCVRVRNDMLDFYHIGHLQTRMESWANSARGDRCEFRFPLLDKRIVEFALGIPPDMFRREGYRRYLFRYAGAGILPDEVRWGKKHPEKNRVKRLLALYMKALEIQAAEPEFLENFGSRSNRVIDRYALIEAIQKHDKTLPEEEVPNPRIVMSLVKSMMVARAECNDRN